MNTDLNNPNSSEKEIEEPFINGTPSEVLTPNNRSMKIKDNDKELEKNRRPAQGLKTKFKHTFTSTKFDHDLEAQIESSSDSGNSNNEGSEKKNLFDEKSNINGLSCLTRYFGPIKGGSLRASIMAMASLTFGGGCLSFPYAIAKSGPILGLIIFILVALVSYWTLKILFINGIKTNNMNYNDIAEIAGGKFLRKITNISNVIITLGLIISYQYIINCFCLQVLNYFFGTNCETTNKIISLVVCCILFQIPLSTMRNISDLQYIGITGTISIVLAVFVIILESPFYFDQFMKSDKSIELFPPNEGLKYGWIDTVGIFLFGFSSHSGIFQIFKELNRPGRRRCNKVLNRSFILEFVLYLMLSLAGFFSTFYDSPDIFLKRKNLDSFPNDPIIIIVKMLLILTMNSCMALNYNILREAIEDIGDNNQPYTKKVDILIVICVYVFTNIITFFLNNAGTLLSFLGGLFTLIICFVVPIMSDIKVDSENKSLSRKYFNYVMLFILIIIGLICDVKSLIDFISATPPEPLC